MKRFVELGLSVYLLLYITNELLVIASSVFPQLIGFHIVIPYTEKAMEILLALTDTVFAYLLVLAVMFIASMLLLIGRAKFFALIMLFPLSLTILLFNISVNMSGLYFALIFFILHSTLLIYNKTLIIKTLKL